MNGRPARSLLVSSFALAMAGCSMVEYSADYDRGAAFSGYSTYDWLLTTEDEGAVLDQINPFLERRLQRAVDAQLADRGLAKSSDGEPDVWVSVYPFVPNLDASSNAGAAGYPYGGYGRSRVQLSIGFGVGFGYPFGFGYGHPYFGFRYPFGYPYWFGYGAPYIGFWSPFYGYPRFGFGYGYGYGMGYYSAGGYGYDYGSAGHGLGPGTIVVDVIDAASEEIVWRGWADGALLEMPPADQLADYVDEVIGRVMQSFPPPAETR